jgi:hypothetical protein
MVIRSRQVRWADSVAGAEEMRSAKRLLGRSRHSWKGIIRFDREDRECEV